MKALYIVIGVVLVGVLSACENPSAVITGPTGRSAVPRVQDQSTIAVLDRSEQDGNSP